MPISGYATRAHDRKVPLSPPPRSAHRRTRTRPHTPYPRTDNTVLVRGFFLDILGVLHETGWVAVGPKGAAARLGMKQFTPKKKLIKLGIS